MAYEVQMPKWGLTMKTGKIARWLVDEGGAVTKGQPLLEVETDKVTNVVEAPASGVLLQIIAARGDVAPVMQVIGLIGAVGESVAAPAAPQAAAKAEEGSVRAMPAARRLARELGVDLAAVKGSGRDGSVTEKDVRAAHAAAPSAPALSAPCAADAGADEDVVEPMEGLRKLIADNMAASLQGAAQLSVFVEADVTEMVALRDSMLARNKKNPDYRLSYNDIIAFAVCRALSQHPVMNSTLQADGIHLHKHVNLGIAVSLDKGLIVPNVKHAEACSLEELKNKVRDVAARARRGGLTMDEITGGTFTISNVSMMGVDGFTPILNPPETAILGIGRVLEKPGVVGNDICIRKMMTLSLTFNHMVTDGGPAMSFLRALADMLEKPVRMLG